jgi:hypothetical protein
MLLDQIGMANVIAPTHNSPEGNLKYLETKFEGAVGTIILNHPEKRNALSLAPLLKMHLSQSP